MIFPPILSSYSAQPAISRKKALAPSHYIYVFTGCSTTESLLKNILKEGNLKKEIQRRRFEKRKFERSKFERRKLEKRNLKKGNLKKGNLKREI